MTKSAAGARFYFATAVVVGSPLGLGLTLLTIVVLAFSTPHDDFSRRLASGLGPTGAVAVIPALIWGLAFSPWMRRRIAEGRRPIVLAGLGLVAASAAITAVTVLIGQAL